MHDHLDIKDTMIRKSCLTCDGKGIHLGDKCVRCGGHGVYDEMTRASEGDAMLEFFKGKRPGLTKYAEGPSYDAAFPERLSKDIQEVQAKEAFETSTDPEIVKACEEIEENKLRHEAMLNLIRERRLAFKEKHEKLVWDMVEGGDKLGPEKE